MLPGETPVARWRTGTSVAPNVQTYGVNEGGDEGARAPPDLMFAVR
jgi:hypothetical protein